MFFLAAIRTDSKNTRLVSIFACIDTIARTQLIKTYAEESYKSACQARLIQINKEEIILTNENESFVDVTTEGEADDELDNDSE